MTSRSPEIVEVPPKGRHLGMRVLFMDGGSMNVLLQGEALQGFTDALGCVAVSSLEAVKALQLGGSETTLVEEIPSGSREP
ncbi:hypothetical protein ACFL6X_02120 [Candidatus Latescibacterota bacterium]